jgi:xanthine dehydrogenase accessory factor
MESIFSKLQQLIDLNQSFVLCTIVEIKGSSPGKTGFKMIVFPDHKSIGTVGGGAIERKVIEDGISLLNENKCDLREYQLNEKKEIINSDIEVVPMMCNGSLKIYYEVYGSSPTVYLFGGGHVGQELAKILPGIGYHVHLIDNREEFASADKNPTVHKIDFANYIEFANSFEAKPNSFALIITHGHTHDYDILKIILERNLPLCYIGVIGSKSKAAKMKKRLNEELGEIKNLDIVHSPVGLPIGGDSASEIAISIAAEMQAARYGKLEDIMKG